MPTQRNGCGPGLLRAGSVPAATMFAFEDAAKRHRPSASMCEPPPAGSACTRFVYRGANHQVITGRSMDWKVDVGTNWWILRRGIARIGQAKPNSVTWDGWRSHVRASGYVDSFASASGYRGDNDDAETQHNDDHADGDHQHALRQKLCGHGGERCCKSAARD